MIRLRLSSHDLTSVVVRPGLGPFGEALICFDTIRRGRALHAFDPWSQHIRTSASRLARHTAVLFTMHGPPIDLFTLVPASDDLDAATDDFFALPDRALAAEFRFVAQRRELPTWTTPLVGSELPARRLIAQAIRDNASAFVMPHWPKIRSYLNTETAAAARRFMTDGLRGMMTGLHPAISWDPPWLTVGRGSNGRAYVMAGQGIAFVPSVFMDGEPIVFAPPDKNDPWLVIYPAVKDIADLARLHGDHSSPDAVAKLIGHSRSDLLSMIAEQPGLSVKDLATLIGLSLGAASEHITVMRNAGLIAGRRQGKAHRHSLTPLGASLLHAGGQARS